jgi:transposase
MARGRFVGIDLAKRTSEICILEGDRVIRHGLKNDEKGRQILCGLLRKGDVVGVEVCQYAVKLARTLEREVGCEVYTLNPGELRVIWKSRKKTDREDALKIAKYMRDTPAGERVSVPLPTEEEDAFRRDISMKEFVKKERTAAINRLHSLYGAEGIIDVTKKDLQTAAGRAARREELPPAIQEYAKVLEEQLSLFDKQLEAAEEVVNEKTRNHELAPYVMSIPGVGLGLASVYLAYIGNGERFTKASQVANYAGFSPRVDCSGEMVRYGSIARHQYCHPIRAVTLEGVWALSRSGNGGFLQVKYRSLSERMGKKKSAVAVARKMVNLAWLLLKRREYCRWMSEEALEKKLMYYKVRVEKRESLARQITGEALSCQAKKCEKTQNFA